MKFTRCLSYGNDCWAKSWSEISVWTVARITVFQIDARTSILTRRRQTLVNIFYRVKWDIEVEILEKILREIRVTYFAKVSCKTVFTSTSFCTISQTKNTSATKFTWIISATLRLFYYI
jgi:hypothetical protein